MVGTLFASRVCYSVLRVLESTFKREDVKAECGSAKLLQEAGADDAEVPPVPIPNTVVKLCRAEDTWLETTRENR